MATRSISLCGMRIFPRQFRPVTYGDSKSNKMGSLNALDSMLRYALLLHPLDHQFDPAVDKVGVSGKAVATDSGHLADDAVMAPMLARFVAGRNVMIFKGFTNDSGHDVATDMAAFMKIYTQARAAGCQLMITMGLDPYDQTDAVSGRKYESIDQALRQLERQNDDFWYVPTTLALLDVTSATRQPITTPKKVMIDGTHESGYGRGQGGQVLARAWVRHGVPKRTIATISPVDTCYGPHGGPVQSPVGNMLGANGTFSATGNSAGMQVTTSGSGAITGASAWAGANADNNYCRLTGTLNGTAALAVTTAANDYLNTEGLRTDITRPRLTLSGTPASDFDLTVTLYRNVIQAVGANAALPYPINVESEFWWQANALAGVTQITGPGSVGTGTPTNDDVLDPITSVMGDVSPTPYVGSGDAGNGTYEATVTVTWSFRGGVALSGSIDLIGAAVRQLYPLQTPAA